MDRMRVGGLAALSLLLAASSGAAGAQTAPDQPAAKVGGRPNILFILTDDHAYQAISAYGSSLARTPNIDRIANEGIRFDRALSPNALCAPARAALLTGKYSHRNGVRTNYDKFDGAQPTLQSQLRKAGYQTALVGKWHLKSKPTGFDHWEILSDLGQQGQYYDPNFETPAGKTQRKGYATSIITDASLRWLRDERDPDRPFLLLLWQKGPHRPFDPDVRRPSRSPGPAPEPPTLFDNYESRPAAARQKMEIARDMNPRDLKFRPPKTLPPDLRAAWDARYAAENAAFLRSPPEGAALTRWRYQRFVKDYLDTADAIDADIGRVLDYLDETGLAANTIVIYGSDQGFYLGEHGWFDKRWIYEPSLRTPLMMRWPGVVAPGQATAQMVSQVDVTPTLLEAAGAPAPGDLQGRSFLPLAKGGPHAPVAWRKSLYYHYYECPGEHRVACHRGVITDRYKLAEFYDPSPARRELYDLATDPHELRNVYDDPRYRAVRRELLDELSAQRRDVGDLASNMGLGDRFRRLLIQLFESVVLGLRLGEKIQ